MSATTASPPTASAAFTAVLNAAVGSAAARMDEQITRWTDRLNGGGAQQAAGASALKAKLDGRGVFKAAVKGAWEAGSPAVRAAIVTAIVATILLLLVSPVLLLVFLLSLLVIAAVHRARRAAPEPPGVTYLAMPTRSADRSQSPSTSSCRLACGFSRPSALKRL